jgi:Mu-like prophage major head subunit gpT
MAMTRAQFARDLQDGLNAHFGMAYNAHEKQYTQIFETKTSKKAFEEQVLRVGLGEAVDKAEGQMITFDAGAEGWVSRVNFHTIALGFAITQEAIDDNLYADLGQTYAGELAKSINHTVEVRGANILNNAHNPAYLGGDGQPLASTSHPLYAGGSFSNKLATSADLSEEALEDAMIAIDSFVDDRGKPIIVKAQKLMIHRNNMFVAHRILNSTLRVGTSNNDANAMKDLNYLPGGTVVNSYFRDPDAWHIKTDSGMGLQFWNRKGLTRGTETDFRTGNMMYKAQRRIGYSWADPRCIYSSDGNAV